MGQVSGIDDSHKDIVKLIDHDDLEYMMVKVRHALQVSSVQYTERDNVADESLASAKELRKVNGLDRVILVGRERQEHLTPHPDHSWDLNLAKMELTYSFPLYTVKCSVLATAALQVGR